MAKSCFCYDQTKLNQKFSGSVSLLAWAYNEEALLPSFLDRAFAMMEALTDDFEIILVNDGSKDATRAIAEKVAARDSRLKVVNHLKNKNVGVAIQSAHQAMEKDYFFFQTVDWSYDLRHARLFLELLYYYDVVKGIRPTPERIFSHIPFIRSIYRVKSRSDNLWAAMVSLSNYYILRLLFGVQFHDFQNIFFARTELSRRYIIQSKAAFANPELLIKAYYDGAGILEVPIHFLPRKIGVAKGARLPFVVRSLGSVLCCWWQWGLKVRHQGRSQKGKIDRVAEPFFLDDCVLRICLPLFKDYR